MEWKQNIQQSLVLPHYFPPVCIIHFLKIHKTESIQPKNISSVTLIHTSAFFKPVPTIDPLTFLLLADLNVLLNVHSWRGRDRHS